MTLVQSIMLIVAPLVALVIALVCLFTGRLSAAPLGFLAFVLLSLLAAMLLTTHGLNTEYVASPLDHPDKPTVTTGEQAADGQKR